MLVAAFSSRKAWLALRTVISVLLPVTQASTEFGRRWLQLTATWRLRVGRSSDGRRQRTLTCEHLRMKVGNEPGVAQDHIEMAKGGSPCPGGLCQAGSRGKFCGGRRD